MLVKKHCITCATRDMTLHKRNPNVFYLLNDLCICTCIKKTSETNVYLRDKLADLLLFRNSLLQYTCINFNPRPIQNNNTLQIRVMYMESVYFTKKHIYGGTKIICLFIYNLSIRSISYIFFYKQMHKLSWIKCKHVNNTYFCLKEKKKT